MTKRKSYQLKAGNIEKLALVSSTLPPPQEDEVTVEVKAIGLNFADVFAMLGLYSATPEGVFIPGLEYSGIVLETGSKVRQLKPGDRVMGVTRFGAYTTHLNIEQRYVVPIPEDWDFATGAAFLVQVLTAYYGLVHLGNIQPGTTVLIHSAAGGVGLLANRIARNYEAYTIGTVGRAEKLPLLKKEGYDAGIVRGKDFAKQLKEKLDGRELKLIMECIGGNILKIGYDQLAPQGRMVVYGSARYASPGSRPNYLKVLYKFFTRPKIDPQKMIELNKAVLGFNLIYLYEQAQILHQILEELKDIDVGKPIVGHTFSFEEMPEAIRLFQSGKTTGKVVVEMVR